MENQTSNRSGLPRRVLAAGALLLSGVIVASMLFLRLPYVIEQPGPTFNTLGEVDGTDLISISGTQSFENSGNLDLTTVLVAGGPGSGIPVFRLIPALFAPSETVLPEEAIYQAGTTREAAVDSNRERMESSQDNAIAAALTQKGIDFKQSALVVETTETGSARGVLEENDELLSVNGEPVKSIDQAREVIRSAGVGQEVTIDVLRDGKKVSKKMKVVTGDDGNPGVGVILRTSYEFPFDVSIKLDDVGGSSAGLMFALGIIDKLTEGGIAHGKNIAGTGTITADGVVGPIGGIKQKMAASKNAGAEWFFIPEGNCADAVGNIPEGLNTVKVGSLEQAVESLQGISEGKTVKDLPQCEASEKSVG